MHSHSHSHAPAGMDPRRALAWSLVLNGSFLFVEAAVGWWSGSLALLSDAGHMLSDVAALALALCAAIIARRPASADRTFGWVRAEVLGGFVNGLTQLLVCAWIFVEAAERLLGDPPPVPGLPVLAVALVGLAINLGSVALLVRSDRENLNIRGALLHMAADALGSVGAALAALLLMVGFPAADAIVSVLIAALILYGTLRLIRDSGRVLLQLPPQHLDVGAVRRALVATPGVVDVHDLHVWTLDGHAPVLSVHLVVADADARDATRQAAVRALRERYGVRHATIQVELATGDGAVPCGVTPCDGGSEGADAVGPSDPDDGHHHSHGHAH